MNLASRAIAAVLLAASALTVFPQASLAESDADQSHVDRLQHEFFEPPDSAKPRVWWHWMNGNISREGIEHDIEWMHRVGLGGLQAFDAAFDTPQVVDSRLVFMTPPWKDAFRTAATWADQRGLELAIAGSPGWSESGGPWVPPEDGMKKLVWSETRLQGGARSLRPLARPPQTVGPFQNVPLDASLKGVGGSVPVPELYREIAVIAYRLPETDLSMTELHPKVTSSAGGMDAQALWDGDFAHAFHLPYGRNGALAWIQMDFGRARTLHSMSIGLQNLPASLDHPYSVVELQSSADGSHFNRVALSYDSADGRLNARPNEETATFSPVTARYFRVVLSPPPPSEMSPAVASLFPPAPKEHQITELLLHTAPRVDQFEKKAGYFLGGGIETHPTPHVEARDVIAAHDVIDVTEKLRPDGTLDWAVPNGHWAILRMGYSLLGISNHPASPEGTGLEVDKLSSAAVKSHMDQYLGRYESILGPTLMGAHGLRAMVNDSWEAGPQNWTDHLPAEFARRRGYNLRPWLPALTGRIIESAEATDGFLWDFRRTLGELVADNHYGQIASSLHQRGMTHYAESHELGRAFIGDGMDAKRHADVPMSAMWVPVPGFFMAQEQGDADIRESASVAHIYGQNLVAAESMTAFGLPGTAYAQCPETLKPTADRELANGLNLFVIHTSAHQPLDDKAPGLTLGPFGQWFSRHETWAEQAGPWVTYLARSDYMLQQGRFVADVLYYYGQDSNITALYGKKLPSVPEGYAFDFAGADALTQLSVNRGDMVTASGMRYRILVLDPRVSVMSLDVLKTVAELVKAGATVAGDRPRGTPSLQDSTTEFDALANAVWGENGASEHAYGAGRVLTRTSIADAMTKLKIDADFSYVKPEADSKVWFVHRHLADSDLYFINNRLDRAEKIEARFRVVGKAPELWHADSGVIEPASYRLADGYTSVPLNLEPNDALFVVFRKQAQMAKRTVVAPERNVLDTVGGAWEVRFQERRGAPEQARFEQLTSWSSNPDARIKYFSGTASYETSFNVSEGLLEKGQRKEIDLGAVKNLAEVIVNGRSAGILWKPPFRADVTPFLHVGINQLAVRVTNLWVNRLIGDKQPGAAPVAFTTFNPYADDSPLLQSGLLGPVQILAVSKSGSPGAGNR